MAACKVGLWLMIQMARHAMPRRRLAQLRLDLGAHRHGLGTPGVETAAAGGIERTRYFARQNHLRMHVIRMGRERVAQEHLGLRMQRVGLELRAGRGLDQLPEVHHADLLTDILDNGQIVGTEQVAEAQAVLELSQEVHHLGAD